MFLSSQAATSTPMKRTPRVNIIPDSTCMIRLPIVTVAERTQIHDPAGPNLNALLTLSCMAFPFAFDGNEREIPCLCLDCVKGGEKVYQWGGAKLYH